MNNIKLIGFFVISILFISGCVFGAYVDHYRQEFDLNEPGKTYIFDVEITKKSSSYLLPLEIYPNQNIADHKRYSTQEEDDILYEKVEKFNAKLPFKFKVIVIDNATGEEIYNETVSDSHMMVQARAIESNLFYETLKEGKYTIEVQNIDIYDDNEFQDYYICLTFYERAVK